MSIWTGCSDQAPTQPSRKAARNCASQPLDVLDVAERAVERQRRRRRCRRRPCGRSSSATGPAGSSARGASAVVRVGVGDRAVARVPAADARRLHAPRGGEVGRAEAHALHARAGGGDLLEVGHALRGLEDRVDRGSGAPARPWPRAGPAGGRRSGCPTAPSTLGTMTTSSLSPISVTSWVRSSSTQGDSSALTRVHSCGLAEVDLAADLDQALARGLLAVDRDGVLEVAQQDVDRRRDVGQPWRPSSRWRSRGSGSSARAGTGISGSGLGRADGQRLEEVAGVAHGPWTISTRESTWHRAPARLRAPMSEQHRRHAAVETDQARARGLRRPPLRPLPRGVRGRRRLQALARQDGDRGRRPPLLPDHDEPPSAAHQRRLRGAVPAGPQRRRRAARLLAGARHERLRRLGQGDRQPRHGGAQAPGARLPRRHAVRASPRCWRSASRAPSPTAARCRVHTRVLNQDGVLVAEFKRLVLVPRRTPGAAPASEANVE